MKIIGLYTTLIIFSFAAACDVQSDITKKSVEKYAPTPTPEKTIQTPKPIDPADIMNVDTAEPGPPLIVNAATGKKPVDCTKYNKLTVNGDGYDITIKGVCRQVMVNGDKNRIVTVGFSEVIFNGFQNVVEYSKYVNGKKPIITDNGRENIIQKFAPPINP